MLQQLIKRLTPRLYLWVVLAVAVPRLAYVAVAPNRNVYGNAPGLLAIADNLVAGKGYIGEGGAPDSYFNPGYSLFLAPFRWMSTTNLLPIKLAQVALDVGTALLLCTVLRRVCSPAAALVFGIAFGLHPLFIHLNNNINDEPLLTFFLTASFVALYWAVCTPVAWRFALAAVLVAAATYTKGTPVLLPFAVAGVFMILGRRVNGARLYHWAMYVALFVGTLLPWAYRNYVVFGKFMFSVRGFATHLEWGSDPRIFTSYGQPQRQAVERLEEEMTSKGVLPARDKTVFEREKFRLRVAIARYRELLQDPLVFARVLLLKAARTFYATEDRPSVHPFILALQIPTIILALCGLVQLWRSTRTRLLAILFTTCVLYYYVMVAAGMPMIRYFAPALPPLLAAAAVGLTALGKNRFEASPAKS